MANVLHVDAFQDNYIWMIRGTSPDRVAIVDPGDADPVLAALEKQQLKPAAILCTHHHGDHVGGVEDLLRHYSVPVYGPARERIPAVTQGLKDGDRIHLAGLGLEFDVLDVPGHTAGHIAFFGAGMLFCGDTLFSAGCGRLFEGTPAQMADSLAKLTALPAATLVCCTHEYTLSNLNFALAVEPGNAEIAEYRQQCEARRARGEPTLPSSIGLELRINPFLRAHEPAVAQAALAHGATDPHDEVAVFAALRQWKNEFR